MLRSSRRRIALPASASLLALLIGPAAIAWAGVGLILLAAVHVATRVERQPRMPLAIFFGLMFFVPALFRRRQRARNCRPSNL